MLEQAHIARHQGRRGESYHLPERKVPGLDGQDWTERLVPHIALGSAGIDMLVGEEALRVLGVVPAPARALRRLLLRGPKRLAYLQHHDTPEPLLLAIQDVGGCEHHAGTL